MAEIIPAILEKDFDEIKNKLAAIREQVKCVHVDIQDGLLTPKPTWPYSNGGDSDPNWQRIMNEEEGLPYWEELDFEIDLMVMDAMENFDIYMKLGPKRIVFHIEAMQDVDDFREFLEGIDPYIRETLEVGVAINPSTPLEKIFPVVPFVDFVQCMAIDRIGFQGEPFHVGVLYSIKILKEKFPGIIVSVDGGVNLANGPRLIAAGADRLVSGSAIFAADDIIGRIEEFKSL